jgi:hypothetical protein
MNWATLAIRRRVRPQPMWLRVPVLGLAVVLSVLAAITVSARPAPVDASAGCRIYVASGDAVTFGKDLDDDAARYPEKLLEEHLIAPGWCLFNQGKDGQTSATYISGGGLSSAYNKRPDLLTIQLGLQNTTIVKLVTDCFDKVKDHDFTGANACAAQILGNSSLWTNLKNNYTTILQQTRIMASQRPGLMIAIVGYSNPYPKAADATAKVPLLCTPLIDTIPTCLVRWAQLPPALIVLDEVVKKLNTSLKEAMAPFNQGPNGWRWVYVDTYTPTRDHCMEMKVTLKTKVEHPEQSGAVHTHDSPEINFGCDEPWYVKGDDGTAMPNYLDPAAIGVLIEKSQTTKGMGVWLNADGHDCVNQAIWEADTIHPGTSPLKWKLNYGEAAETSICQ